MDNQTTENQVVEEQVVGTSYVDQEENKGLITAIKIFMIIPCVASVSAYCKTSVSFFCIPLIWMLPMTIITFKRFKEGKPLGTAFKVLTLLFVNIIAGVCMLCLKNDKVEA